MFCDDPHHSLWISSGQSLRPHLVLLQPFLQQLLAALLQDGPAQLQGFKLVELALIQKDTKVLQQRRGLTRLGGDTLKLADGLRRPQDTLRGEASDLT